MREVVTVIFFSFITIANLLLATKLKTAPQLVLIGLIGLTLIARIDKESTKIHRILFNFLILITSYFSIFVLSYFQSKTRIGNHFSMDLSFVNYLIAGLALAPLLVYYYHYYLSKYQEKMEGYFLWIFGISYTLVTFLDLFLN